MVASYNAESNTNDSFGSNNGTAVGGLTYVAGKIGNAFQFNGSNSYVSLPNDSLNFTGDFSVNAWVNLSTYTGYRGIASSYKVVGSLGYGWMTYHEEVTNQFALYLRDGSNHMLYRTNGGIPLNSYNMITWVRQVGQDPKIYINGVLSPGSYTFGNSSINPSYQSGQPCNLGGWNNTSYGTHKQDGTTIWSKTLTQSEINELYNSGNGAQYIGDNFYKPTTNDSLGINNGTAQGGLTYGPGKVGTAFQFNGTNAYVSFTPGSFNSLTTDFSISAWVYLPSGYNSTNNCPIFSNMSAPGWFETPGGFWLRFAGTTIQLSISGKLNPTWLDYNISNDNLLGTWIHVVAVRKNSTSSKIYINNVLKASNTDTVNPVYYTGVNLTIPTIGNVKMPNGVQDGYYAYDGSKIDAVGIWNKSLTESEITELYNSGNGKQYPN